MKNIVRGYIIHKDFSRGEQRCVLCHRELKANKAYYGYIYNNREREYGFFGKSCAEKIFKNLKTIPDLTKSLKIKTIQEEVRPLSPKEERAISYLLLRQEKLKDFKAFEGKEVLFRKDLEEYKKAYMEYGTLEEEEIEHITNIEKKVPRVLGLENLLVCYAYAYKIELAISYTKEDRRSYLQSKLDFLKNNCYLHKKDIEGIKKWFDKIEDKEIREGEIGDFVL